MAAKSSLKIDSTVVPISNLDKVLYPAGRFLKAHVIDYYVRISPFLLPHLKNRPVTFKRFPDGVRGEFFYEKDAPSFTPNWIRKFPVPRRTGEPDIQYILINDLPTLVWVENMAGLELHPFLHRAPAITRPTMIVFDLDPGEGMDILDCARVAALLKEVLDGLNLTAFIKVSGSKGLQVYVPLNTEVTYAQTQPFAEAVAQLLARRNPRLIVAEMAVAARKGKIFIDWSQNAEHKTTVSVYSLRAKSDRPFVSMPVAWDELARAVKRSDRSSLYFEPAEALTRVSDISDLFAPVETLKQHLPEKFQVAPVNRSKSRSLVAYEGKRNFARTSEPAPGRIDRPSRQGSRRRFVVQKHAASHLHFDLRLEMGGVLKSWALPKPIPLQADQPRSAFQTEDHPIEYLHFEGTIPKGQYGGGTVMVWDFGSYELVEGNYYKGNLRIFLNGRKLKGEWLLERTPDQRTWRMVRIGKSSRPISKQKDNLSALTDRTMEEIAADKFSQWQSAGSA
jgi:bifunctional non-homologous end joining protein LigD